MYWVGRSTPPSVHLLYTPKSTKKTFKKYKPQIFLATFIGIETNKTLRQVKIETILMTVVVQILALFKSLGVTRHIGHVAHLAAHWLAHRSALSSGPFQCSCAVPVKRSL